MILRFLPLLFIVTACTLPPPGKGAKEQYFLTQVKPVLQQNCVKCHDGSLLPPPRAQSHHQSHGLQTQRHWTPLPPAERSRRQPAHQRRAAWRHTPKDDAARRGQPHGRPDRHAARVDRRRRVLARGRRRHAAAAEESRESLSRAACHAFTSARHHNYIARHIIRMRTKIPRHAAKRVAA